MVRGYLLLLLLLLLLPRVGAGSAYYRFTIPSRRFSPLLALPAASRTAHTVWSVSSNLGCSAVRHCTSQMLPASEKAFVSSAFAAAFAA